MIPRRAILLLLAAALCGCNMFGGPAAPTPDASAVEAVPPLATLYFYDAWTHKPVEQVLALPTYKADRASIYADDFDGVRISRLGFPFVCRSGLPPAPAHEQATPVEDFAPILGLRGSAGEHAGGAIFIAPGYEPVSARDIEPASPVHASGTFGERTYVVHLRPSTQPVQDLMGWIVLLGKDAWGEPEANEMPVLRRLYHGRVENRLTEPQRDWVRNWLRETLNEMMRRPRPVPRPRPDPNKINLRRPTTQPE